MWENLQVRFLGGWAEAMSPGYPAPCWHTTLAFLIFHYSYTLIVAHRPKVLVYRILTERDHEILKAIIPDSYCS